MSFHLNANFVALANVADTEVPALSDGIMLVQNGHHVPAVDMKLLGVYSSAVTLLRTRLVTPKIQQMVPAGHIISPVGTDLLPATDPNVQDMRPNGIVLRAQEEIAFQSTDSAAGPNNHYVISWLQRSMEPTPAGEMFTTRAAGTTTAVASTWTLCPLTFETRLPAGVYAVVGARGLGATMIAFQFIFDQQYDRPGGLGGAAAGTRPPWWQQRGGLGKWGEFTTVTLPRAVILCNAADISQTFEIDLVRLR